VSCPYIVLKVCWRLSQPVLMRKQWAELMVSSLDDGGMPETSDTDFRADRSNMHHCIWLTTMHLWCNELIAVTDTRTIFVRPLLSSHTDPEQVRVLPPCCLCRSYFCLRLRLSVMQPGGCSRTRGAVRPVLWHVYLASSWFVFTGVINALVVNRIVKRFISKLCLQLHKLQNA
jgi:hypothetical protein